ncbi:MAG: hypothetical protein ACI4BB_10420 [Coprococcus sp.]
MARKKKNDFWDDVDEMDVADSQPGDDHTAKITEDEEWSAVKSLPLKVIMRFVLMIACLVALGSAYIAYVYVGDRYAGGSYSTDFYNSGSFAAEYNKSIDQLLQLVQAMEDDPSVTQAGNEELLTTLVENYMGKDTNFSFMILDGDKFKIASSGDDAKDRITSSNHYLVLSNVDGETGIQSPIAGKLLNKDEWNKTLSETSNTYIIYTAVDNELTHTDAFYQAEKTFDKMEEYFGIARFVGIIAAVIFVICLIFCIMSTGMKRGYDGVCLSWFDKIFTEIALVIMAVVAVALVYAIRRLMAMNGDIYQYAGMGLVVVTYAWIIRSYFSIVRRIKAGCLLKNSIIGTIIRSAAGGIGKLPSPLNVILGAVILIVINGALVYGVIFMRQYTVKGIPIMFIVAPVVFVIELLALLARGGGDDEEEEGENTEGQTEESDRRAEDEPVIMSDDENFGEDMKASNAQGSVGSEEQLDWEAMDLGKAIEEAERKHASQMQKKESDNYPSESNRESVETAVFEAQKNVGQKTELLSVEDVEKAIRAAGLTPQIEGMGSETVPDVTDPSWEKTVVNKTAERKPEIKDTVTEQTVVQSVSRNPEDVNVEADGWVNFVQLNKDVRKEFRTALKSRGIGVTVRAPEKPVIIDIDRNSLYIIISDIFSQIERLSARDSRTYVEIYLQGGKVVYIVKISVSEDLKNEAAKAAAGEGSFDNARKIIEANDGKFVVSFDGSILKVGMLIDAAE